jgi:hypothetical protein
MSEAFTSRLESDSSLSLGHIVRCANGVSNRTLSYPVNASLILRVRHSNHELALSTNSL